MSGHHELEVSANDASQRRALLKVLVLNTGLAVALMVGGLLADSSALVANALDNASDAAAYTVSYFAVVRSQRWKAVAAGITGVMLLVLAVGVTVDAARRLVEGSAPLGGPMIVMALVAVAINAWSVQILRRFRGADVNLRAAWTMSLNDFASNLGIVAAGGLVAWLGTNWPDLAVALVIALLAVYGGWQTLKDAYAQRNEAG